MRKIIPILFIALCTNGYAQNADTFHIETLPKPTYFLPEVRSANIYSFLKADIEKSSTLPDSIVYAEEHPFLTGLVMAFKEHRPFVFSPDVIWLLISQGFSRHIVNNAELFRKEIVGFENKKELIVKAKDIDLGNPDSNWEALFQQFITQINDYTGMELTNALTADFTTTTATAKIVSQITVMETMKPYFDYKVLIFGCGIPRITIEGTAEDWEKILAKTKYISRFKLEWWTTELEPVLQEIINTKKGNFNKEFWMNMVQKGRAEGKPCSPTVIDGWIVKFFPYTKEGKTTDLKSVTKVNNLASELVKVPFVLEDLLHEKKYKMEFWAGIAGLSQNKTDYTLKPEIGWAINNKSKLNPENSQFKNQITIDDLSIANIDSIPDDIYTVQQISFLHLSFLKEVNIPDQLAKMVIKHLEVNGRITDPEEQRIMKLFPNTKIIINGKQK